MSIVTELPSLDWNCAEVTLWIQKHFSHFVEIFGHLNGHQLIGLTENQIIQCIKDPNYHSLGYSLYNALHPTPASFKCGSKLFSCREDHDWDIVLTKLKCAAVSEKNIFCQVKIKLHHTYQTDCIGKQLCGHENLLSYQYWKTHQFLPHYVIIGLNDQCKLSYDKSTHYFGLSKKSAETIEADIVNNVTNNLSPIYGTELCLRSLKISEFPQAIDESMKTSLTQTEFYLVVLKISPIDKVCCWKNVAYVLHNDNAPRMVTEEYLAELVDVLPNTIDHSASTITNAELDPVLIIHYLNTVNQEYKVDCLNTNQILKNFGIYNRKTSDILFGRHYKALLCIFSNEDDMTLFKTTEIFGLYKLITDQFLEHLISIYPDSNHTSNMIPKYSKRALREALVNAIIHSDYSDRRDYVINICIYPNRVTITNFCSQSSIKRRLIEHQFAHKNHLLIQTLRYIKIIGGSGMGLRSITMNCLEFGYKLPIIETNNGSTWSITLLSGQYDQGQISLMNTLKVLFGNTL
jgi:hypothetical protein